MPYVPISGWIHQHQDSSGAPYSGAVLKAYSAGTSSNISMATDYTGLTTFTSVALDSNGYPSVNGSIVIPHVNEDYKLALYPDQTAADANSGAIWTTDTLPIGLAYDSISGYVRGEAMWLESDTGCDSTSFDIDANISTAWESIGPTGSGATNIWTALDSMPSGARWVELKITHICTDSTGAAILQLFYLRATGSSAAIGNQTLASDVRITAGGASSLTASSGVSRYKVPVDSSGRFDAYFVSDGTSQGCEIYLAGFGV